MKISNSKKELARIISENGGWCGAANLALFGKVSGRCYMLKTDERPECDITIKGFYINARDVVSDFHASPFTNWHQTILSRAEYFHLYPAPDADGWIEWDGGECPVGEGDRIDVKFSDGDEFFDVRSDWSWDVDAGGCNIIAYRLHKPEQSKPEFCESVMRSIPEPEAKPTIEQLATDYRNAKDYADRKQQEADAAKGDADSKLKALELAGEAIGLTVSPITERQAPELVITDWRQWRVGDVVSWSLLNHAGEFEIISVHHDQSRNIGDFKVKDKQGGVYRVYGNECRFIRRP